MKLKRFKVRDNKRIGIIVFTIACILLVSGVILYRTFAIFEVKTNQNVINGTIQDPGNIYFAFYVNDGSGDKIQKEMPTKNYILDESKSFCGVNGDKDPNIKVTLTDEYGVYVTGMSTSRTKCNLYFVKGAFILGKPINATSNDAGLYETTHEGISGTLNDDGFKETEWRYAGDNPDNYVWFNDELWRIIGLVNVMTNENTVEQRVKIIRNDSIGNYAWDSNNSNDWTKSILMTYINSTYFNTLNENVQSMIDSNIMWNLGAWNTIQVKTAEMYLHERGNNHNNEYPNTWPLAGETDNKARIGLMNPSDYGYAVGGKSRNCIKDKYLYDVSRDDYRTCKDNNWLYLNSDEWLLTSTIYEEEFVNRSAFFLNIEGYFDSYYVNTLRAVRPVIYLSPNVKILNDVQDGSDKHPYNLKLVS